MNEKLLEDVGLTKGEVRVYLTLLKIGETTTGKIIEEAEISSGKIYEILDKLIRKGLVGYIVKEKTKYFVASSPNRILDFVKVKEKELKGKEDELRKELPFLLGLRKDSERGHETTLFKGLSGIRTAIFEALNNINSKNEVLAMGIVSSKNEKYNILWEGWHSLRVKRKIVCRAIFSDRGSGYYGTFKKMNWTKVRVLKGVTPSAIDVIGNSVLIFTYGEEPSCLVIKNSEVAGSFRVFFETMWKVAK